MLPSTQSQPSSPFLNSGRRISRAEKFHLETTKMIEDKIADITKQMVMDKMAKSSTSFQHSMRQDYLQQSFLGMSPKMYLDGILEESQYDSFQNKSGGKSPSNKQKFKESKYKNVKAKVETRNNSFQKGMFEQQDWLDKVLEKENGTYVKKLKSQKSESELNENQNDQNTSSRSNLINQFESTPLNNQESTALKEINFPHIKSNYKIQIQSEMFTPKNDNSQNTSKSFLKLENMHQIPKDMLKNGNMTQVNFSGQRRLQTNEQLDFSTKIGSNTSQKVNSIQSNSVGYLNQSALHLDLSKLKEVVSQKNNRANQILQTQKKQEPAQIPQTTQTSSFTQNLGFSLKEKIMRMKLKSQQQEKKSNASKQDQDLFDFWHYKYDGDDKDLSELAKKLKDSDNFQNFMLMKMGLNKDYKEQYNMIKISEQFERRSQNPRLHLNKNQVMYQLMSTFTNKTYFNQLKQSNKDIEKQLNVLGLNYDSYKSLANQLCKNFSFTKDRISLIQRNDQLAKDYQDLKEKQQKTERSMNGNQSELYSNIMREVQRLAKGEDENQQQGISEQSTYVTTSRSNINQFKQPDLQNSVISNYQDSKAIFIANNDQFKKLIELLNLWYDAQDPQHDLHIKNHEHKNREADIAQNIDSQLSPASLSDSVGSSHNQNDSLSKRKSKKSLQQSALYKMGNLKSSSVSSMGTSARSSKKEVYTTNNPNFNQKSHDSEVQEFSKYINSLLFKSTDPFLKRKFKAYQAKQNKTKEAPNFFKRMEEDQKNRNVTQQVIETVRESGDQYKLSRLKKLSEITNIVKQRQSTLHMNSTMFNDELSKAQMADIIKSQLDNSSQTDLHKSRRKQQSIMNWSSFKLDRLSPKRSHAIQYQQHLKPIKKHSQSILLLKNSSLNSAIKINLELLDEKSSDDSIPKIEADTEMIIKNLKDRRKTQNTKKNVNFDIVLQTERSTVEGELQPIQLLENKDNPLTLRSTLNQNEKSQRNSQFLNFQSQNRNLSNIKSQQNPIDKVLLDLQHEVNKKRKLQFDFQQQQIIEKQKSKMQYKRQQMKKNDEIDE
eukprot:403369528